MKFKAHNFSYLVIITIFISIFFSIVSCTEATEPSFPMHRFDPGYYGYPGYYGGIFSVPPILSIKEIRELGKLTTTDNLDLGPPVLGPEEEVPIFSEESQMFVIYEPPEDLGTDFLDSIDSTIDRTPSKGYGGYSSGSGTGSGQRERGYESYPRKSVKKPVDSSNKENVQGEVFPESPSVGQVEPVNDDGEVVVAVIDSGVDSNSSKFDGVEVEGYRVVNGRVVSDSNQTDECGHGTKVTDILLDNAGRENIDRVLSYKVFGEDGKGNGINIFEAAKDAIKRGADIVNMSIGLNADDLKKMSAVGRRAAINSFVRNLKRLNNFAERYDAHIAMAAGNNGGEFNIAEYLPEADNITFVGDENAYSDLGEVTVSNNYGGTSFAAPQWAAWQISSKTPLGGNDKLFSGIMPSELESFLPAEISAASLSLEHQQRRDAVGGAFVGVANGGGNSGNSGFSPSSGSSGSGGDFGGGALVGETPIF